MPAESLQGEVMGKTLGKGTTSTQRGFTLVETMVAMVVLSIGLLGVAKLVTGAVHANDSGYMRGQATQLAYEILDQMRANRSAALSYTGAGAAADCISAPCAPTVLAGLDMLNWNTRVAATLPGGTGTVTPTAGAGGTVAVIQVSWDDSEAQYAFGGGATQMSVELVSML